MNILKEIKLLRGKDFLNIIPQNSNPYRLLIKEDDGITAYYFSCPIYDKNKKLIKLDWIEHEGVFYFDGSNAKIEASGNFVSMTNDFGFAEMEFDGDITLEPTFNGVAITVKENELSFLLKTDGARNLRENGSYFALMQDEFVPFVTVSGICGKTESKCYPLEITQETLKESEFKVTIKCKETIEEMLIEVNLHAPKLMFDTSVESKNPDKNNAFGGTAFIGNSEFYGEQWLYSRFDTMQLIDLNSYIVKEANFYLPKFNNSNSILASHKMTAPWCSFGSTWNSKTAFSEFLHIARKNKKYEILEVSDVMQDILRLNEPRNPGIVITGDDTNDYSVVPTGDNYLLPQILEIKLKNN